MNVYEEIKLYLRQESRARERANKNRAIANMLGRKYGLFKIEPVAEGKPISKDILTELVGESLTYDRAWRKVLEECPELRGSDYYQKTDLARAKQRELGYDV